MEKDKLELYLWNVKQHHAQYHHHKEQMAFGMTGLYAAGVAALLATENSLLAAIASLGLSLMAFLFIKWQFSMRKRAACMNRACDNFIFEWLTQDTLQPDTELDTRHGEKLPKFLADEYDKVSKDTGWQRGLESSKQLTYLTIAVLALLLIARILFPSQSAQLPVPMPTAIP